MSRTAGKSRSRPLISRPGQPRYSECQVFALPSVYILSPQPCLPISPSLPPAQESRSVLHALDELSRTGPVPQAKLWRSPYSALHRIVSMPTRASRVSSRDLTPIEEVMQEADFLRREIQQSQRKPSEREHALLDAFVDPREYLNWREMYLPWTSGLHSGPS
jgi:hypothetical protein